MNAAPGSSPTKRRAALASLDANAMNTTTMTTPASIKHTDADSTTTRTMKQSSSSSSTTTTPSRSSLLLASAPVLAPPVPAASPSPSVGTKRRSGMMTVLHDREYYHSSPLQASKCSERREQEEEGDGGDNGERWEESPVSKKSKLDTSTVQESQTTAPTSTQSSTAAATSTSNAARSRTQSPDASSVFDTEGGDDTTWVTTATESDVAMMMQQPVATGTAAVVTQPRALTREQAREKMEILRLRLGLASYKLRTGQTSVPLDDLQARPLPITGTAAAAAVPSGSNSSSPAATVENTPSNSQESVDTRQDLDNSQQDDVAAEDVVVATPPTGAGTDL